MNAPIVSVPDRSLFLGGSDAAAVLGVSPWNTPVELYLKKTRQTREVITLEQQRRHERGHKLEPFIREMAVDKLCDMGLDVELVACNERYIDPEYDFLSCEIDFELRLSGVVEIGGAEVHFEDEHINADAKSVTGFARKKWGEVDSEDVPIEYAAQFMHGLMVTGRRYCLVAALRSFDDVDIFWTVRDDETIAAMRPKLVSFWQDHVLQGIPPDTWTFNDVKALFPLDNGEAIEATEEIAELVAQLKTVKARIKVDEEVEEDLKKRIADYISPNSRLSFDGRDIATWKGQNDTRLDLEAFRADHPELYAEYARTKVIRVLRLPSPKKGK